MIGWIKGTVVEKAADWAIVDAGGVGYRIAYSATTAAAIPGPGGTAEMWVHTHVRENEIALFGFAGRFEKDLFERLIAVSDIGPRKAVAILSGAGPADLVRAIRGGDLAVLTAIPGVGKKTAERLLVEMKDRIKDLWADAPQAARPAAPGLRDELVSALVNLGYRPSQAERAVEALRGRLDGTVPIEGLIREALDVIKRTG